MEIKQLQYFLAAAQTLNFTEAAKSCYIVQSAMSQQIASLEKELGVALFIRNKRSLTLTHEGEVLLAEARGILNQITYSKALVQNAAKGYQTTFRLGRYGDLLRDACPDALRSFAKRRPDVTIRLTMVDEAIIPMLKEREIDAAIGMLKPDYLLHDWLGYRILTEEPVKVMLPADHPLAHAQSLTMASLSGETMILLHGDKKARIADWIANGCSNTYLYVDSQNSVETLVAAGYGISPCVASACRAHPGIVYAQAQDAHVEKVGLFWNARIANAEIIEQLASEFVMILSNR